MMFKSAALAALVASVSGQQMMNLTGLLANTSSLSNLTTYLGLFPDLVSQLSSAQNITILAPSNQAFATLLNSTAGASIANNTGLIQAIFQYHVLNGTYYASQISKTPAFVPTLLTNQTYTNVTGGQRVEAVAVGQNVTFFSGLLTNSTVTSANNNFTGGTVHIIDRFLTIPENASATALATNLTSLYGALNFTSLVETVDTSPNLTIFAPNNQAFSNIASALANISKSDAASILQYHVVSGLGYSSGLTNGTVLTTLSGGNITITIDNGTVFANAARVVTPNVLVANGVVHVIDEVLNPMNSTAVAQPSNTTPGVAFPSASRGSAAPFTSNAPAPSTTAATATSARASSASAAGAVPMKTAAVGAAALFGGAAYIMNM